MRILIADDDLTSLLMLGEVLRRRGHEVLEAADGEEAWSEMQRADAPGLAILDWEMPGMDGLEVVRRIRAADAPQPPYLLMLTARDRKADLIAGLEAGANDYLSKPFDPGELLARVEVGGRMLEMQARLAGQVSILRDALDHIKTLQGVLPICMYCKNVLDDKGCWNQLEAYVSEHSDAAFSHGICPECAERHWHTKP